MDLEINNMTTKVPAMLIVNRETNLRQYAQQPMFYKVAIKYSRTYNIYS